LNEQLEQEVSWAAEAAGKVLAAMGQRLVGQQQVSQRLLMALVCEGHILLEGLPGLAKTTAVRTLADVSSLAMQRIQFTPDMLPADVIGTQIYNPKSGDFTVKQGPVFANLVIADEINRAPAKVQSALLQAMQEGQVTIGDTTFPLPQPFLVMATQNPIEQEGTYSLPEAQVDRFLFKVVVGYGTPQDEVEIMNRMVSGEELVLPQTLSTDDLARFKSIARQVHMADKLRQYIVDLVFASRGAKADLKPLIAVGASPRASINLERAARANAVFGGRAFVTPQDVKDVAHDVLRHRLIPSFEAEAEGINGDQLVTRILETVDVP